MTFFSIFSSKDKAHRGKYKSSDNAVVMLNGKGEQVVLFSPTPPYLVKPEMQEVIEWTNKELESGETHPILAIANLDLQILAIHPFKDGNGRISRALPNLLLLKAGYSYVPYVSLMKSSRRKSRVLPRASGNAKASQGRTRRHYRLDSLSALCSY